MLNLYALKNTHALADLGTREGDRSVVQKLDREPADAVIPLVISWFGRADQLYDLRGRFGAILLDITHELILHARQACAPDVVQQLLKSLLAAVGGPCRGQLARVRAHEDRTDVLLAARSTHSKAGIINNPSVGAAHF